MKTRVRLLDGGAFSPIAAFVVLLVVLVGVAAFALTRPDPAQPTATATPKGSPSPPDHSLTDAEAISVFRRLDSKRLRGIETRDGKLAASAYVDGAPVQQRVLRDIAKLERTDTKVKTSFRTRKLEIIDISHSEIRLRQTVVVQARFTDAAGRDVGTAKGAERQVIEWVLKYSDDEWLIQDAKVLRAQLLQ